MNTQSEFVKALVILIASQKAMLEETAPTLIKRGTDDNAPTATQLAYRLTGQAVREVFKGPRKAKVTIDLSNCIIINSRNQKGTLMAQVVPGTTKVNEIFEAPKQWVPLSDVKDAVAEKNAPVIMTIVEEQVTSKPSKAKKTA